MASVCYDKTGTVMLGTARPRSSRCRWSGPASRRCSWGSCCREDGIAGDARSAARRDADRGSPRPPRRRHRRRRHPPRLHLHRSSAPPSTGPWRRSTRCFGARPSQATSQIQQQPASAWAACIGHECDRVVFTASTGYALPAGTRSVAPHGPVLEPSSHSSSLPVDLRPQLRTAGHAHGAPQRVTQYPISFVLTTPIAASLGHRSRDAARVHRAARQHHRGSPISPSPVVAVEDVNDEHRDVRPLPRADHDHAGTGTPGATLSAPALARVLRRHDLLELQHRA